MKILNYFSNSKKEIFPCNITIGVFDGLHLGHQLILKKLKEKSGLSIVITFENHPLKILYPEKKISLIYNLDEKLKLLKSFDIDIVVLIKFSLEFATCSYLKFLQILKNKFAFKYLVVGDDVKIGKNQEGDKFKIKSLENILNYKVEFIKKVKYEKKEISSSWIRQLIDEKNYFLANKLLNRNHFKENKCQTINQLISLAE